MHELKNMLFDKLGVFGSVFGMQKKLFCQGNFKSYFLREDINSVCSNFVKNLDNASIFLFNSLIYRLKQFVKRRFFVIFFRTKKEKLLIKSIKEFKRSIVRTVDDLFLYKNYILQKNDFTDNVFYFKHGLDDGGRYLSLLKTEALLTQALLLAIQLLSLRNIPIKRSTLLNQM
jgi:hypothetical protein